MNNTYTIREKDFKKVLDQIDSFKTKMELFQEKYSNYSYNIDIKKELDEWLIKLNIRTKDEQKNTQAS